MRRAAHEPVRIEHPSGIIDVFLKSERAGPTMRIIRAGVLRTARKLFTGQLYVPARLWQRP